MTATFYDFGERLLWSQGYLHDGIAKILKARIPGCYDVQKADELSDRNGTDYWALRHGLTSLSVDVKVREKDFAQYGQDDLALETWSVVESRPGWTRDQEKQTDYILWFWQDTGRFCIVSFPALCCTFQRYWRDWATEYKTARQSSGTWLSECVFVPRQVVLDKLSDWANGTAAYTRAENT